MPVPALRFDAVSKRYGARAALDAVSLEVAAGECVALIGINGAGKTTLLRCLLDFARPDSGRIAIHGIDSGQPRARRRIAFLPERFVPPHYLTGADYLRMQAELRGLPWSAQAAAGCAAALDLDPDALDRPVRALSKGMTQKLGLAACLASACDLYVLDEPTSGLDPKARALLARALRERLAHGGTLFYSSHALGDVEALAGRIALLHEGRLRYLGDCAGLCAREREPTLERALLRAIDTL
jgi:ABC-2 type transport system ATP-binding protein